MISLITATLGRTKPIRILLDSLVSQTYSDFEIIIVDQNQHEEVHEIVKEFESKLTLTYIKNGQNGLSLNRNLALSLAKGEFIGFPDDDCYYSPDVLERVVDTFKNNKRISFCATDWYDSIVKGNKARSFKSSPITKKDVYKKCISFNIFIRQKWGVFFDERLGVGAQFGAGEETDYLYTLMEKSGLNGYFFNSGGVFHPVETNRDLSKIYNYARGQGAVWKKDFILRKNISVFLDFILTVSRYILSGIKHLDFSTQKVTISGLISGFYHYNNYKLDE